MVSEPVPASASAVAEDQASDGRPTTPLALGSLLQISIYWFALNAIWGGFELFQQERTGEMLGQQARVAVGVMDVLAAPIALLTMPLMGSISDYVGTRWGRRKPFILVGSLLAAASLVDLALAPSFPLLMLFFLLLQLTSNIARGPFAGLVPDLVPEKQVGLASGLMGLMSVAGLVGGYLIIWTGYQLGPNSDQPNFTPPVLFLAAVVALTGIGTFLWTPNGPPPKPREGRSWVTIGFQTFGRDILRERSYVFLLGSRFFILMAAGFFMNLNVFFLADVFGMGPDDRDKWVLIGLVVTAVATGIGTLPGARLSDVVGRKPVIYASAVMGAVGMALLALAPVPEVVIVGIGIVGLASGAFLSVDWALMTDIIPKASAGRYMGLSNIVEATNGPAASAIGGFVMYGVGLLLGPAVSARIAMFLGVIAFTLGALLLRSVQEPRRARRGGPKQAPEEGLTQPTPPA